MVGNMWLETSKYDIEMKVMHIPGKINRVADLLSRWNNSYTNNVELQSLVEQPVWHDINDHLFHLDYNI